MISWEARMEFTIGLTTKKAVLSLVLRITALSLPNAQELTLTLSTLMVLIYMARVMLLIKAVKAKSVSWRVIEAAWVVGLVVLPAT